MINGFSLVIWLAASQMPIVQAATLGGKQHEGVLEAFSSNSVIIKTESDAISIPLTELLSIHSTSKIADTTKDAVIELLLIDKSLLRVATFNSTGATITAFHPKLGELKIPISIVANVRMAPSDSKVDMEWTELSGRTFKKDVVVIRKGDVLDHLDGVVGALNESTLQFRLDGDEIPIKREKIFGLIFSKRESMTKKAIARLELTSGDRLAVKQIAWNGMGWTTKTVSGQEFEIATDLFHSLDYSLDKVTYLSDMEPRSVQFTPFFGNFNSLTVTEFRRDMDFQGDRISLLDSSNHRSSYAKGIAIHSRNLLKYRLGGEFRRFQTIMGIGAEVPNGEVDVVLKGDQRVLFEGTVKALEAEDKISSRRVSPMMLDLDVSGVNELEIFVDWGRDKLNSQGKTIKATDIGDRLYLANARLIK